MSVTSVFMDGDVAGTSRSAVESGCAIGGAEYMPDSHALGWTAAQSTTVRIAAARCIAVSVADAVGGNTGDGHGFGVRGARSPIICSSVRSITHPPASLASSMRVKNSRPV